MQSCIGRGFDAPRYRYPLVLVLIISMPLAFNFDVDIITSFTDTGGLDPIFNFRRKDRGETQNLLSRST